jgi:cobalt/nickel transport protein
MRQLRCWLSIAAAIALMLPSAAARAHFQVIEPSLDSVTDATSRTVTLRLLFTHPMLRGPAMQMDRPVRFGVTAGGKTESLEALLQPIDVDGKQAWQAAYDIRNPGDYVFFVEPRPYWEPGEQKMIIHYAKVVVDGFGAGGGWDAMVGLPVEIRPLARPYGLWTGNVFRGIVERDGKPVPFAEIEVEWLNDGSVRPDGDGFVTQVIKSDAAGEFSYGIPRAGWWGFAALVEGKKTMKAPTGKDVPVEEGGLMWVRAVDMR